MSMELTGIIMPSQRKGCCMFLALELIILCSIFSGHNVSIGLSGLLVNSQLPCYFLVLLPWC